MEKPNRKDHENNSKPEMGQSVVNGNESIDISRSADTGATLDGAPSSSSYFSIIAIAEGTEYELSQQGVFLLIRDPDGEVYRHKLCTFLVCFAWTRDSDNCQWGRVVRIGDPDGVEHVMIIPSSALADEKGELRSTLLSQGVRIIGGMKAWRKVIYYLENYDPIKRVRCVAKVGWHGNVYVMGDNKGTVIGSGPLAEEIYLQATVSVRLCRLLGNIDDWRLHVASLAVGNSRLAFVLSSAFAGALLHILGVHSGSFNLRGSSSIGKTKLLIIAVTVFGNHVESWRATDNAMEAVAAAHNDRLMVVDELGQLDVKLLGSIAYMLGNERGKTRMTGAIQVRKPFEWRLLLLSSSELSMSDMMESVGKRSMAGQDTRMVDIPAAVGQSGFGVWENLHGFTGGAAFSDHVEEVALKYSGSAGEAFIRRLAEGREAVRHEWQPYKSRFISEHVPADADGQVLRVAERFALVGFAGWLATTYGITGWPERESEAAAVTCMKAWLTDRGSVNGLEWEKALDQIRLYIERHGSARFQEIERRLRQNQNPDAPEVSKFPERDASVQNRVGFKERRIDGVHYFILPEAWRKELCKGYDSGLVADQMAKKGYLQKSTDGKLQDRRTLPGLVNQRCYHLLPTVMGGEA